MAGKITDRFQAVFKEKNSQLGARAKAGNPMSGPATKGGASAGRQPNGGKKGGVFRAPKGPTV